VANVAEAGYGTFQVGQKEPRLTVGRRDHCMRTPGQLQQDYPRELALSQRRHGCETARRHPQIARCSW